MGTKDPRADAEKYLEKHNVRGLFKHLSTKVLFAKPEDPKAFLVQELKKVQECQQEQQPVSPPRHGDAGHEMRCWRSSTPQTANCMDRVWLAHASRTPYLSYRVAGTFNVRGKGFSGHVRHVRCHGVRLFICCPSVSSYSQLLSRCVDSLCAFQNEALYTSRPKARLERVGISFCHFSCACSSTCAGAARSHPHRWKRPCKI
jgi:hypothetical protein